MKERLFRFKQFAVRHAHSSMPVGVDGVLVGAWAYVAGCLSILDVGTGCGLIALICAQRCPEARVLGIDIHAPSVEEANENFATSPWAERLRAKLLDFCCLDVKASSFDLIISNPPFFDAGLVPSSADARQMARHSAQFGPLQLLHHGASLLSPRGRIAMITPVDWLPLLEAQAAELGLALRRVCWVKTTPRREPKRVLTEFASEPGCCQTDTLVIQTAPELYTPHYRALTADFYLKF